MRYDAAMGEIDNDSLAADDEATAAAAAMLWLATMRVV
jgi:hypothetical protein